jgi:hypothetical protein
LADRRRERLVAALTLTDPGRLQGDLTLIKIERLRQELRIEARKFVLLIVFALAATFGLGVAFGRYWLGHQ